MKKLILILLVVHISSIIYGKNDEFKLQSNGLIYNDSIINNFRQIVDSLNAVFETQKIPQKKYHSKKQALAHYIVVQYKDVKEAKSDIENNMGFDEFIKKYPHCRVDDSLVVISFTRINSKGEEVLTYQSTNVNSKKGHRMEVINQKGQQNSKNKWIFDSYPGSEYSGESVWGFYFLTDFKENEMPNVCNKMINYANCLIDTSKQINKNSIQPKSQTDFSKQDKYLEYIYAQTNKPQMNKALDYRSALHEWDSLKYSRADSVMKVDKKAKRLLIRANEEAQNFGSKNEELEDFVGQYLSKKEELKLKVARQVVGQCSQDASPRHHEIDIALLSAETMNWQLFLRSHLNIMNDRFNRVSDGSYAWNTRKTYLKELEELHINTVDLLLGISMLVENPSDNQYFGSISRIGQALSDSRYSNEIEKQLLSLIQDSTLDDYNKINLFYLFQIYNSNVTDLDTQKSNHIKLKEAISNMPSYIYKRIASNNYELEYLLRNEIREIKDSFLIIKSHIGSTGSIDWDMDTIECWEATLFPHHSEKNILFSVTMANGVDIGSIQPLMLQKDSLLAKVDRIDFLTEHLKKDSTRYLEINFTIDQSFSKKAQLSFIEDLPMDLKISYTDVLDELTFVTLHNEFGYSRWLIFPNNEILLWHFSGKAPIENLNEEDIIISRDYFKNCMKMFDSKGHIIKH